MTNDGGKWAATLADKLHAVEAAYRDSKSYGRQPDGDPELAREEATAAAGLAVHAVVSALSQLPEFRGGVGLLPLQDLLMAMTDLLHGTQAPLLKPTGSSGTARDSTARNYIKKQAVAGVMCLMQLKLDEKSACDRVASEFNKAGVPGRKRGPDGTKKLTGGSVIEWVSRYRDNPQTREQVDAFVDDWRRDEGEPMTIASVIAWITRVADSPAVQSKI